MGGNAGSVTETARTEIVFAHFARTSVSPKITEEIRLVDDGTPKLVLTTLSRDAGIIGETACSQIVLTDLARVSLCAEISKKINRVYEGT